MRYGDTYSVSCPHRASPALLGPVDVHTFQRSVAPDGARSRVVVGVARGVAVVVQQHQPVLLVPHHRAVPAVVFRFRHVGAHVGRVQQQGADGLDLLAQLAVEVLGAAAGVLFTKRKLNALYL